MWAVQSSHIPFFPKFFPNPHLVEENQMLHPPLQSTFLLIRCQLPRVLQTGIIDSSMDLFSPLKENLKNLLFSSLTLSWRGPLSYRNQSIDLQSKSMDWFLYDNDLRHERVNHKVKLREFVLLIKLFIITKTEISKKKPKVITRHWIRHCLYKNIGVCLAIHFTVWKLMEPTQQWHA